MAILRGIRHPVGTWLVCRQCRQFYTHAKPCPCRRQESPQRRGKLFPSLKAVLSGLRGWWHGDV